MSGAENNFRVFTDTNILISAVRSRKSVTHQLVEHLVEDHHLTRRLSRLREIPGTGKKRHPAHRCAVYIG